MIDIDDSPHRDALLNALQNLIVGMRCDEPSLTFGYIRALSMLLKDWQSWCAKRGIYFPDMAIVVLPSANAIELLRRDLDNQSIEVQALNICTKHPRVNMVELAAAIRHEFPRYRG